MIYLIRVDYKDFSLAKIGYAKNIKKRFSNYRTENPMAELIAYREGSSEEEKLFHLAFFEDKFEKGKEWFYWKTYTLEKFKSLNYNDEYRNLLINKIKSEKDLNKKLILYDTIKIKYDKNYVDCQLEKLLDLIESLDIKISDSLINLTETEELIISKFLNEHFYKTNVFEERMKMYCEFRDEFTDNMNVIDSLEHRITDQRFHQYYKYYGTIGCKKRKYRDSDLKHGWEDSTKEEKLSRIIYASFKEGDRLSKSDLKIKLGNIYASLSLFKTPKATDLSEYFEMVRTNVVTLEGKKNGFKLGRRLK